VTGSLCRWTCVCSLWTLPVVHQLLDQKRRSDLLADWTPHALDVVGSAWDQDNRIISSGPALLNFSFDWCNLVKNVCNSRLEWEIHSRHLATSIRCFLPLSVFIPIHGSFANTLRWKSFHQSGLFSFINAGSGFTACAYFCFYPAFAMITASGTQQKSMDYFTDSHESQWRQGTIPRLNACIIRLSPPITWQPLQPCPGHNRKNDLTFIFYSFTGLHVKPPDKIVPARMLIKLV
jgi:hypothetical protein